ncbi:LegC family aminotransferase [Ferrimonas marina]|uniref:Aminotransferase, LLPSF_NHT_00031 family n=1 Tax=Ferrimonas marina TaxID=299255 RepID=A0A1M5QVN7_9GAMM|nr:LegC family aminotransferase [Ferrimonas marina]SHH17769.1 hypothetical protein SAMN02745129_1365 [Ferrimonas marina]
MEQRLIHKVREIYRTDEFIPLHAPRFDGAERAYVNDTLDSTFVSSVGAYVDRFEQQIIKATGAGAAVATVNGTAALHTALHLAGVQAGDLVLTQALTFVATCNALKHMGAEPVLLDVSPVSLGLCPEATEAWLCEQAELDGEGQCRHRASKAPIRAILPMHSFGHPVQLTELSAVAKRWNLALVEDAAEALGSLYRGRPAGSIGLTAALSFNGNKVITTGGGGMVLCQSSTLGARAKHLTTTAKLPHAFEYLHDEAGFNYRMPNLNAALGCGQMEQLDRLLHSKRQVAEQYRQFFAGSDYRFIDEPDYAHSNFWLNGVICPDRAARDQLLEQTNAAGVMTRPVWQLMHRLPMYQSAQRGPLPNAEWAEARVVNLPSSALVQATRTGGEHD